MAKTKRKPAPLTWSRCKRGKASALGRRQVWAGYDFADNLCASIERFPEQGSRLFMIVLDLIERQGSGETLIVSRVMGVARSFKRAKATAAALVAKIGNVKRYATTVSNVKSS